ncbi:flavodoxin family protein [Lacticaseibacillus saniviri]
MKILGLFGGQSTDGQTYQLMATMLGAVKAPNTTEIINLNDYQLQPDRYQHPNAVLDQLEAKLDEADVWVLASPTYFGTISGQLKQFLDCMRPRLVRMTKKGDSLPGKYKDKHYISISSCFASAWDNTFTHQTDQTFRTIDKAMTTAGLHKITELVLPNTWREHTLPDAKRHAAITIGEKLDQKSRKDDETLKRYLLLFGMIALMSLVTMGIQQLIPVLTTSFLWRYISFVLVFFVLLASLLHYETFMRHKRR